MKNGFVRIRLGDDDIILVGGTSTVPIRNASELFRNSDVGGRKYVSVFVRGPGGAALTEDLVGRVKEAALAGLERVGVETARV